MQLPCIPGKPHVRVDAGAVMHGHATGSTTVTHSLHAGQVQPDTQAADTRFHLLLLLVLLLLTNTSNSKPNFLKAHCRSSSDVPGAWPPNLQHTSTSNAGRTVICNGQQWAA
jgi:hypothetical protein